MNLEKIFKENLNILQRKLKIIRSTMKHSSTKGFLLEQAVTDFLSCMLPNNLGITSGFIVDSNGNISDQIDIMIYDKYKAATFFNASGIVTMPCEFVYLVVEVKTNLNPSDFKDRKVDGKRIRGIYSHLNSVKALRRIAISDKEIRRTQNGTSLCTIQTTNINMYGKGYLCELPPPVYIVFTLESGNLKNIKEELEKTDKEKEFDKRVDFIFTPKGCITNFDSNIQSSSLTPHLGTKRIIHPAIQQNGGNIQDDAKVQKEMDNLVLWFCAIFFNCSHLFTFGVYDFDFLKYYKNLIQK